MTQDDINLIALLEALEGMARQHCYTESGNALLLLLMTDSYGKSANADALRLLAKHGRFRIVHESGRMVVGYWQENDPGK